MTPIRWVIAVLAGIVMAFVGLGMLAVVAEAAKPKDSPERACNEAANAQTGDDFTVTDRQQFGTNTVYLTGTSGNTDLICVASTGDGDDWFAVVSPR